MTRSVKYALMTVAGIILAVALVFVVCVGFVWWSLERTYTDQSSGPTTRGKALGHCGLPLPLSAHNIEYSSLAGGLQEGEFWVRFEAPVPDCYSTAQTIFVERSKTDPRFVVPAFRPVDHPSHAGSVRLRTDWFDTERISKGVVAGTGYGWEPRIWIDEERGVFYYTVSD